MDNLNLPAYPLPLAIAEDGGIKDASDWNGKNTGFTKLEKASLMIAAGMAHTLNINWLTQDIDNCDKIAKFSNKLAKAVIEEANK